MKKYRIEKRRRRTKNPVASELKDKKFQPRVVRPDKIFDRQKHKQIERNYNEDLD